MRLTARGTVATALVALAVVLGWVFGQPGLNAVAAPLGAALVVALLTVWRAEPPTARYESIPAGQLGDARTVALVVEGSGLAAVERPLPAGLAGETIGGVVSLPHRFEERVTLDDRGVYTLDSPTVVQRDVFGFVEQPSTVSASVSVAVYPNHYRLADHTPGGLFESTTVTQRGAFDHLREYTPGDPLRDIHWKSSAKRDELAVVEYEPAAQRGEVLVAAEGDDGYGDEMAAAAATVALSALATGLAVDLRVPDAHCYCTQGTGRDRVLRLLAEAEAGVVAEHVREEADIWLRAGIRGTTVRLADGPRRFDSLLAKSRQSTREGQT